jgi:transposase
MFVQLAHTLEEHQEVILNHYNFTNSTGPLEGANTKIQLMRCQAYGFRKYEFFKLKILGIHETHHALGG